MKTITKEKNELELGPDDVALILKSEKDSYAKHVLLTPSRRGKHKQPLTILEIMVLAIANKMEDQ